MDEVKVPRRWPSDDLAAGGRQLRRVGRLPLRNGGRGFDLVRCDVCHIRRANGQNHVIRLEPSVGLKPIGTLICVDKRGIIHSGRAERDLHHDNFTIGRFVTDEEVTRDGRGLQAAVQIKMFVQLSAGHACF